MRRQTLHYSQSGLRTLWFGQVRGGEVLSHAARKERGGRNGEGEGEGVGLGTPPEVVFSSILSTKQ